MTTLAASGLAACGGGDASDVFRREPVDTRTDNPFMPSVGTDDAAVTPPADAGGTFPANTPGLYGGTMNVGSCDREQMTSFLESNPDKARAWASVLGVRTSEIRSFVSTLTPVVLRSDVAVTNHGFQNGATSIPAVLQAGTAVLVDGSGVPVVKCFCGNPLTAPPPRSNAADRYRGARWPAFDPRHVTEVDGDDPLDELVLVDDVGNPFRRPTGTAGTGDVPGGTPTPGSDGTTTTTAFEAEGLATTERTYSGELVGTAGVCLGVRGSLTIQVGRIGVGNHVVVFNGGFVTGRIRDDDTFDFDAPVTTETGAVVTSHVTGRAHGDDASGTITVNYAGSSCTYEFTARREGT